MEPTTAKNLRGNWKRSSEPETDVQNSANLHIKKMSQSLSLGQLSPLQMHVQPKRNPSFIFG